MRNCKLFLLTAAVLAVLAMPALALPPDLKVDFWSGGNEPYLDFDEMSVSWYGEDDPSKTFASGITVTLDGRWGGRSRWGESGALVDNPPDFTTANLLNEFAAPWAVEPIYTVTVSGLEPNLAYNSAIYSWEFDGMQQGFDLAANGVPVADDWVNNPYPTDDNDCRLDFQATADEFGVVVLEYSDPLDGAGQGVNPTWEPSYKTNALEMLPVPEPGTLVLLLSLAAGLGLVSLWRRK